MSAALDQRQDHSDVVAEVVGLRIDLPDGGDIVSDVSFTIKAGEVLGLVGESGSGKTTVGMAMLGFARGGARIAGGEIFLTGDRSRNLLTLDAEARRRVRGTTVAYVPQDPAAALNPSLRIRKQLAEVIEAHEPEATQEEIGRRITAAMHDVGLPSDDAFLARYPHQLSGGQQQRIGIAMAIIMTPKLIVLDEPTTGLDVTTQNKILNIIKRLCREHNIGALHVTHDLSVMAHIADTVMVMYAGRVVELGRVEDVLKRPRHPYTQALLGSVPELRYRTRLATIPGSASGPRNRPAGCFFSPRCVAVSEICRRGSIPMVTTEDGHQVLCLKSAEVATAKPERLSDPDPASAETLLEVSGMHVSYGTVSVLKGVDLTLRRGECLALVGESGSGKSTMSRALIGLIPRQASRIVLCGEELAHAAGDRTRRQLQTMQYIFQSPHNSLNPRQTVEGLIGLVHDIFFEARGRQREGAIVEVLAQVRLPADTIHMFPDELSGGQRQRVAIARALMANPKVLICDEITSALDVSVQASIINLLKDLQAERGLSILFVTHNLALVRNLADRVLVLDQGVAVEVGSVAEIVDRPQHPYTRQLLANALEADIDTRAQHETGSQTSLALR